MDTLETLAFNLKRKSPRTLDRYTSLARQYLDFSKGKMDRTSMLQFIDLVEKEWKPNTQRLLHYALKKLCKSLEVKFPLDADDLPIPTPRDELNTPFLSIQEIGQLVDRWQWQDSYETSILYLSTVYGLRSLELTNVEIMDSAIKVHLAKKRGGQTHVKMHMLPPGAKNFLSAYRERCEWDIIQTYHLMARAANVKDEWGAWHKIRRSLITGLQVNGLNGEILTRFIGWEKSSLNQPQGVSPMVSVYFHMDDFDIDRETFLHHPFIKLWKLT